MWIRIKAKPYFWNTHCLINSKWFTLEEKTNCYKSANHILQVASMNWLGIIHISGISLSDFWLQNQLCIRKFMFCLTEGYRNRCCYIGHIYPWPCETTFHHCITFVRGRLMLFVGSVHLVLKVIPEKTNGLSIFLSNLILLKSYSQPMWLSP